jgi:protein NRD1
MPVEQREKLSSMIKIWQKGDVFPAKMLAEFQEKLSGQSNQPAAAVRTNGTNHAISTGHKYQAPIPSRPITTPVGYPPQHLYDMGLIQQKTNHLQLNGSTSGSLQPQIAPQQPQQQPAPAPQQDVNSILAALANIPKPVPQPQQQPASQPAPAPFPQQNAASQLPPNLAALLGQQTNAPSFPSFPPPAQQPTYSAPTATQPYQMAQGFPNFPPQPPPSIPQQYPQAPPPQQPPPQQADPLAPLRNILPANILNDQVKLVEALKLLQDLQKDGIPMDQWGPVLEAFASQYKAPAPSGYDAYGRGRSRSPERAGRRRASPVYGTYEDMNRNQGMDDRNRGRYRQRSPIRNSPIPIQGGTAWNGMPMRQKVIHYDNTLPRDNIKVLSRTLFVGGASGSQQEIQELFERFGRVQTCIANREKRHAFVKMTSREDALNAKENMERLQSANDREVMNIARQTKWGVGFGPRECCNYGKGESIIPIDKLTDADMKWLLTAEYGGTGGLEVKGGMVLEEPDIEIGAGVSSKAMSKRVGPENNAQGGRQRQYGGERNQGGNGGGRKRYDGGGQYVGYGGGMASQPPQPMQMEQYGYARPEPVAVATPPAVPGFGFTLPGAGQSYR